MDLTQSSSLPSRCLYADVYNVRIISFLWDNVLYFHRKWNYFKLSLYSFLNKVANFSRINPSFRGSFTAHEIYCSTHVFESNSIYFGFCSCLCFSRLEKYTQFEYWYPISHLLQHAHFRGQQRLLRILFFFVLAD